MSIRSVSRKAALQFLFQEEFSNLKTNLTTDQFNDTSAKLDQYFNHFKITKKFQSFARPLVMGVLTHIEEIDQKLAAISPDWKTSRMAFVDKNLLRIGIFEILHSPDKQAPAIIINEAINLSKTFGSAESSAFINGILQEALPRALPTQ